MVHNPLVALAASYFKFGGKLASKAGELATKVAVAAQKFLTVTRVRSVSYAAQNKAYAYSDKGPIKDPLARIEELRRVTGNPEAIQAKVNEAAGDLQVVHPEWVGHLSMTAQAQLAALAQMAPQLSYDPLGRPLQPPAGQLRQFLEFENAVHDLNGTLQAIGSGQPSAMQIKALQMAWPSAHAKLVTQMLANPEVLQRLDRAKLRAAQAITGLPLTNSANPDYNLRQVQAWQPTQQPAPQKPQAFNINPEGPSLPSQSSTGRAPGN